MPGLSLLPKVMGEETFELIDWRGVLILCRRNAHSRSPSLGRYHRRHGGVACVPSIASLHESLTRCSTRLPNSEARVSASPAGRRRGVFRKIEIEADAEWVSLGMQGRKCSSSLGLVGLH